MSTSRTRTLKNRKRRIENRLAERHWPEQDQPMFRGRNIHYQLSDRTRGLAAGGLGAMLMLARRSGLVHSIDEQVKLLKAHLPYHESDHVLNIAFNTLCGGRCLEDLELRRNDEVYLDALGTQRIPDPTTAGDFCRRFDPVDIELLMGAINESRLNIWRQQPAEFFDRAVIDVDGTLVTTSGSCKEGMDIAYTGEWGYQVLLVSLSNTQEPLYLVNRSGNRPSHEGAAQRCDQAIELCLRAGFRNVLLRGDTDFSQTACLDGWNDASVQFVFGIDAMPSLKQEADNLPETGWKRLNRPQKHEVRTVPRERPPNVKEQIVCERGFEKIRLNTEEVNAFSYQPRACARPYRIVVVRKNLSIERGEEHLFDDVRYFFFITNLWDLPPEEVVAEACLRCDQENLIEQLKHGVRALHSPVDNLYSNWAYMVMASLGWTLKAWFALSLPAHGRWRERHSAQQRTVLRMEFRTFVNAFMQIPAQIVRSGRRLVYRLLGWNPWQAVFLRGVKALSLPLRL